MPVVYKLLSLFFQNRFVYNKTMMEVFPQVDAYHAYVPSFENGDFQLL
jgi:hypothetical protein